MPSYGLAMATRVRGPLCTALVVALPLGVLSFFISHYSLYHEGAEALRGIRYVTSSADATPSAGSCIIALMTIFLGIGRKTSWMATT
jgi:uncharacterized membrane protein YccF (DUF307 family)